MSKTVKITEVQYKFLTESVYMNNVNTKKKKIGLTYQQGNDYSKGNYNSADMLKTDKMDQNNTDTYEVQLKGGITSYNITSIKGTEVMHYFKNHFSKKKTNIKVKNKEDNSETDYELSMEEQEFLKFKKQFISKISTVVKHCLTEFKNENNEFTINALSIYPVPSTSNFNIEMSKELKNGLICGLPVKIINQDLLLKDLRNLEKDSDFIERNKDYYNGKMSNNAIFNSSVNDFLDTNINRYKAINTVKQYINEMNVAFEAIKQRYYNLNASTEDRDTKKMKLALVEFYKKYYDAMQQCHKVVYKDIVRNTTSGFQFDTLATALKYSKGPSIDKRSGAVWALVKPFLRGVTCPITNKPYTQVDINKWTPTSFQIKNFSNGERMGLKNFYNLNTNETLVQQEIAKIKGTALLIFDDNVSGGATLSDICYQFKQMGVEYLIPITFGEMQQKWTMNMIPLNKPTNNNGEYGKFNLS